MPKWWVHTGCNAAYLHDGSLPKCLGFHARYTIATSLIRSGLISVLSLPPTHTRALAQSKACPENRRGRLLARTLASAGWRHSGACASVRPYRRLRCILSTLPPLRVSTSSTCFKLSNSASAMIPPPPIAALPKSPRSQILGAGRWLGSLASYWLCRYILFYSLPFTSSPLIRGCLILLLLDAFIFSLPPLVISCLIVWNVSSRVPDPIFSSHPLLICS